MHRCAWAESDPALRTYHDEEWGVPEFDALRLWEKLALDGFQAGLSWLTVLRKREALRRAFAGFDPNRVARFGAHDLQRLLRDPGIIRSRAKIVATIAGARAFLALQRQGTDLSRFAWGFTGGRPIQGTVPTPAQTPLSAEISQALKAQGFRFVGPVIVYAWMQAVGMVNDHAPDCFRRTQVQRAGRPRPWGRSMGRSGGLHASTLPSGSASRIPRGTVP